MPVNGAPAAPDPTPGERFRRTRSCAILLGILLLAALLLAFLLIPLLAGRGEPVDVPLPGEKHDDGD